MSCSHHQSPEEIEAQRRLLDQFLGKAKPAFPAGHYRDNDEGELAFAVAADREKGVVVIRFGKSVDWLGLRKNECLMLSEMLKEKADQL